MPKPSTSPTKDVATRANTVVSKDLSMFEADANVGFQEGIDQGAYAMPFLSILQGLSPQVQRGTPQYIDGAMPGRMINSVTKDMFDELDVTVVRRTHTFCMWLPREQGGGFKGEYDATPEAVAEFQMYKVDDKNRRFNAQGLEVTEHRNFYCQVVREEAAQEPVLVSLTKSMLPVAKQWNSLISMKCVRVGDNSSPVLISEIWTLKPTLRKKGENQWYVFSVVHKERHANARIYGEVRAAVTFAQEQKVLPRSQDQVASQDDAI